MGAAMDANGTSTKVEILPAYLTPAEAGRFIGAATQTLARWRCEGGGPDFIRVGRKIMYGRDDLIGWMSARRVSSTSQEKVA